MIQDHKNNKINSDKIKNNYLKLKNKVGMAVLKSKQTRLVGIISTYIVHPYSCFLSIVSIQSAIYISLNKRSSSITLSDEKSKRRDIYYVCTDYPYYSCLFAF